MAYTENLFSFMIKFIVSHFSYAPSICELGNQLILPLSDMSAKYLYELMGFKYLSIDWNGEDGALPIDLNKPISGDVNKFDIVTNLGVSEHVKNNKMCFDNMHKLCKINGYMIHVVPMIGNRLKHKCFYRYTLQNFKELVDKYNYETLKLSIWNHCGRENSEDIICIFKKEAN